MKLTLAAAVLAAIALSGCTTLSVTSAANSCKNPPTGTPKIIKVDIKEKRKANKKIEPVARVCARPGDLLQFRIKVRDKNSRVEGKTADDDWIEAGTKNKKAWYWLLVPEDILPEDEDELIFEYTIFLDDFDDLDPEVRVRRTF